MSEAPPGERATPSPTWELLRAAGATLATLAAVSYALVVMVAPLDRVLPPILADVAPSGTSLARVLTAATCGILITAVLAAGAIGRQVPPWLVLAVGLLALSAAAVWVQSIDTLTQLALVRAMQGIGAGAVLTATPALASTFGPPRRAMLSGTFVLTLLVTTAIGPWAAFRLPFPDQQQWRHITAPYPWLLAIAVAGTTAVAVASLIARAPTPPPDLVDERANRFGWPLLVPSGIAAASFLIKPQWESPSGTISLYSLLLATVLLVAGLGGVLLSSSGGWRPGTTPPLLAVTAMVLPVTGTNALNVAIVHDTTWPLATKYVLPALGGAALAGAAAALYASSRREHLRRTLLHTALLVAAVGAATTLVDNAAATAVGSILVWAGVGAALGVTLRGTGVAAGAWAGALFAVGSTLATSDMNAIRNALVTRAFDSTDTRDPVRAVRDSFVTSQRIWIAASVVVLVLVALLVSGLAQRAVPPSAPAPRVDSGAGTAADTPADTAQHSGGDAEVADPPERGSAAVQADGSR